MIRTCNVVVIKHNVVDKIYVYPVTDSKDAEDKYLEMIGVISPELYIDDEVKDNLLNDGYHENDEQTGSINLCWSEVE